MVFPSDVKRFSVIQEMNIDSLLSKIEFVGDQLKGYTEKMVFSFAGQDLINSPRLQRMTETPIMTRSAITGRMK